MKDVNEKELAVVREIQKAMIYGRKIPTVRELMVTLGYKSPRSISLLLESLENKKILKRREDGSLQITKNIEDDRENIHTIEVPLVGAAPCGAPLLAEENIETTLSVSIKLARPPHQYFVLRAIGDSMNLAGIESDNLVLVRQQETANEGDIVIALIDDEATIKELHYMGDLVMLKPRSKNKTHRPIIVTKDFRIQGVVIATLSGKTL